MGTTNVKAAMSEVEDLVSRSMERAEALLRDQMASHDRPFEAFVTLTLSIAVMAKALRMPRETLLEGVSAAYISLEEVEVPHVH